MDCKINIFFTLLYYNLFHFPLTKKEIFFRMICLSDKHFVLTINDFDKCLNFLLRKKVVLVMNGFYSLWGIEKNIIERKKKEIIFSNFRFHEIELIKKVLNLIPFIKSSFLTGSSALHFSLIDDDYDLMVIVTKEKLWFVRFLLLIITTIMNRRRSYDKSGKKKWCLNILLEETHLIIPKEKRNLFSACQLSNMVFLTGDKSWKHFFIAKNYFWLKKYLLNLSNECCVKEERKESNFLFFAWILLNKICFFCQWFFLKNKISYEIVKKNQIFFHPQNRNIYFLDQILLFLKKKV